MRKSVSSETPHIKLRIAVPDDAGELLQIYAPYVTETAITFEYKVPSVQEFAGRISAVLEKYPYLVAEADGEIVGYAYAGPFKERAAYDWAAETTVYVKQDKHRRGIGLALYNALERLLVQQNVQNLNACIAFPEAADKYLSRDSLEFHRHLGYRLVGEFHKCGYKFAHWYDMIWMEKHIGSHAEPAAPVKWFSEIRAGLKLE